jgi:hypothetical protein
MDADQFDNVARSLRSLATSGSRRSVLGVVLSTGTIAFLRVTEIGAKSGKNRKQRKRKGSRNNRNSGKQNRPRQRETHPPEDAVLTAEAVQCEPPRPSATLRGCNYNGRTLVGVDMHASTLTDATFRNAKLCGAKLYSAQLKNADFRGADLTKADLHSSGCVGTKFSAGTTFCRTIDCNGNLRNDDCPGVPGANVCCTAADCRPGATCEAGRCMGGCDVCPSGCPFTSLEDAINDPGIQDGDTIRICPGTYPTVHQPAGVLVNKDLTIIGAGSGPGGTILDAQKMDRVLRIGDSVVDPGNTVTIRDLTITGGQRIDLGFDDGGGIFVNIDSTLTLERVIVTGNTVSDFGGGIYMTTRANLIVKDSQITNNSAASGGGIQNQGDRLTLDATLVQGNTARDGGGIYNADITELKNNTRVTGNTATDTSPSGGGIYNGGIVSVSGGSTVTGNTNNDNCFDVPTLGTGCPV